MDRILIFIIQIYISRFIIQLRLAAETLTMFVFSRGQNQKSNLSVRYIGHLNRKKAFILKKNCKMLFIKFWTKLKKLLKRKFIKSRFLFRFKWRLKVMGGNFTPLPSLKILILVRCNDWKWKNLMRKFLI